MAAVLGSQNRMAVQISLGKKQEPISKITRGKRGWSHGSCSREPPSKCEALNSSPVLPKTNQFQISPITSHYLLCSFVTPNNYKCEK
jgi:hypothetical protein